MSKGIPTAFGFDDTLVRWTPPSEDNWEGCVVDVDPESDGGRWMEIEEAREYAANIIAACDAAESYRDTTEVLP